MRIKLNHCVDLGDWYTIVRAKHDGREWMEQIGPNSSRFMCSERLSPEACIEGNAHEMLAVANAIKKHKKIVFERVAVNFKSDGVHFHSPRNSEHVSIVSVEEADEFAEQVLAEIGKMKGEK